VPAFTLWVAEGDYDVRHHTVQDTFEHVDQVNLARDTAIMAILARALADSEPAARRLSAAEATELMRKIGVEGRRRWCTSRIEVEYISCS
jgi:acyl-CoA reductase-like NAD-dependent aldehyde dehydrogenase